MTVPNGGKGPTPLQTKGKHPTAFDSHNNPLIRVENFLKF